MTAPASEPPAIVAPAPVTNVVSAEVLGSGLLYSIGYERLVPRWNAGVRIGAGYFAYPVSTSEGAGDLKLATFPLVASWYYGKTAHKLQLGAGATLLWVSASTDALGEEYGQSGFALAATAVVGYRYLRDAPGVTFGAGFTPLWRSGKGLLPWGGANVGYAF